MYTQKRKNATEKKTEEKNLSILPFFLSFSWASSFRFSFWLVFFFHANKNLDLSRICILLHCLPELISLFLFNSLSLPLSPCYDLIFFFFLSLFLSARKLFSSQFSSLVVETDKRSRRRRRRRIVVVSQPCLALLLSAFCVLRGEKE